MFRQNVFQIRVKQLREEKKLTMKELAEAVDMTRTSINHWEGGSRLPSLEALCRLADYFEVPADYLLGQTDER